jgi:phosphatidylethanolamine/phosphatidyl-N-methylethanolamine N-methyltransferase
LSNLDEAGVTDTLSDKAPACAPWMTFLLQWMKNPLSMSSVTPSGRQLAGLMVAALPVNARRVVELGAGTGPITRALLARGIAPENLLIVEMNEVLHGVLRATFPTAKVVCGDARQLEQILARSGPSGVENVDAVASSLGLLAMPKAVQRDILSAAFAVLGPDGVFVQYTYGLGSPISDELRDELGLESEKTGFAWRNLPPASVYVYRRARNPR